MGGGLSSSSPSASVRRPWCRILLTTVVSAARCLKTRVCLCAGAGVGGMGRWQCSSLCQGVDAVTRFLPCAHRSVPLLPGWAPRRGEVGRRLWPQCGRSQGGLSILSPPRPGSQVGPPRGHRLKATRPSLEPRPQVPPPAERRCSPPAAVRCRRGTPALPAPRSSCSPSPWRWAGCFAVAFLRGSPPRPSPISNTPAVRFIRAFG